MKTTHQIKRYHSIFQVFILCTVVLSCFSTQVNAKTNFFVSPDGDDLNTGNNTQAPLQTISYALELAQPGDSIKLMSGEYIQNITTVRAGTSSQPILIIGSPGAVVKGTGKTTIANIQHSYIELKNFTIDGLFGRGTKAKDYRKKLVYIKGLKNKGIRNVKLLNMTILNARDECIRIKYFAQNIEVANSRISHCGTEDFLFNGGGHNGEAIYIGTAPEQLNKNPTSEPDQSNNNWIHNNFIEPFGSECVDVKEGSSFNVIEYNQCSHEKDKKVAGIAIRGNQNIVRHNIIYNNMGAGIRLGGDLPSDGIENDIYGNQFSDNKFSALKIMAEPQGKICGNTFVLKGVQQAVRGRKGLLKSLFLQSCQDS